MSPASQSELWADYLVAESRGLRDERNAALDCFLDAFCELPIDSQRRWALQFAAKCVDDGDDTPVRMPLFRRVLLPALRSAITERKPGAARWLAGFTEHIYRCSDLRGQITDGSLCESGLLRTALDHDPSDDASRRRLVDLIAGQMEYSLHELPAGVLYGHDGATVAQCGELLSELEELSSHVDRLGIAQDFSQMIARCRFHYTAYARYLASSHGPSSYAEYLSELNGP